MLVYWILILLPFTAVVVGSRFRDDLSNFYWLSTSLIVVLVIGMRYQVGGDWENYLVHLEIASERDFLTAVMQHRGPSYGLLNWVSANVGLGIYGVNLVCGALLATGLAIFCRRQPIPWLAWLVATPYLLIVVGMGYTRQSAALGLLLWGLVFLEDKKIGRFALLILIGATFHKSVLLMAPLVVLGLGRSWWIRIGIILAVVSIVLFVGPKYRMMLESDLFEATDFVWLWNKYVQKGQWTSGGALHRIWMNAIPAAIMLLAWRPWKKRFGDPGIWNWLAVAAIGSVVLVGLASTAVDRINLYIAPLQLYVWSRFPLLFRDMVTRTGVIFVICLIYFAALWVWLNSASHAYYWLPYKSIFSS